VAAGARRDIVPTPDQAAGPISRRPPRGTAVGIRHCHPRRRFPLDAGAGLRITEVPAKGMGSETLIRHIQSNGKETARPQGKEVESVWDRSRRGASRARGHIGTTSNWAASCSWRRSARWPPGPSQGRRFAGFKARRWASQERDLDIRRPGCRSCSIGSPARAFTSLAHGLMATARFRQDGGHIATVAPGLIPDMLAVTAT